MFFLIKLRINFQDLPINEIKKKLNQKKYFRIIKRINQEERDKFWSLGEKAIKFEPFEARMYTHGNLFSHIVGQVDYDNYGISGVEMYFNRQLKSNEKIQAPLILTLDSNLQYLIFKSLSILFLLTKNFFLLFILKVGSFFVRFILFNTSII